jgi:hypothetical protein
MPGDPPAKAPANGHGNGRNGGLWGAVSRVGQLLIGSLPPAFLVLVLLNLVFLAQVLWFVDHNLEARNELINKMVDRCFLMIKVQPPGGAP